MGCTNREMEYQVDFCVGFGVGLTTEPHYSTVTDFVPTYGFGCHLTHSRHSFFLHLDASIRKTLADFGSFVRQ